MIQDVIPGIAFFLNLPLSHNIQVIEMQVLYCINSILLWTEVLATYNAKPSKHHLLKVKQ